MINLDVLDKLAKDHLQFEVECAKAHGNGTDIDLSSDSAVVCALHRIRDLVMDGCIENAVQICEALCSSSVSDPHLQLDIRIHKFCELIYVTESFRRKDEAQYEKAVHETLEYAQQLASFALNAFPEAYEVFTEAMMLFALPEQTASPEAIRKRRERLASHLISLARFSVCARESNLSFLIRYLLLIYVQFNTPLIPNAESESNPVDSLVSELLCCEQSNKFGESLITWKTDESRPHRSGPNSAYEEADIQALRERANITRQESLDSLGFAHGNLSHAMKNELGRVMVDQKCIRKMVVDYCASRSLPEFHLDPNLTEDPYSLSHTRLSPDQRNIAVPINGISPSIIEMYHSMKQLRESTQRNSKKSTLQRISTIESIIGTACTDTLKFRLAQKRVLFHLYKKDFEEAILVSQSVLGPLSALHSELFSSLVDTMTLLVLSNDNEYGFSGDNQHQNDSAEPVRESEDPFKSPDPMNDEEMKSEPNTHQNQNVGEESFEATMRDCNRRVTADCSFASLIEEAYDSLKRKYGEPNMILLLRALLLSHQNWEKRNMMRDQLAQSFFVSKVLGHEKEESSRDDTNCPSAEDVDKSDRVVSTGSAIDRHAPSPESREQTILVLMEFMNMSRAEAIAVLRNHPQTASTQSILDSLLGSLM